MNGVVQLVLLLTGLVLADRLMRNLHVVPPVNEPRSGTVSASVVVPARDEEANLPALLRSVRRLDVGVAEVVVVDDGSRDRTASVARESGATVLEAGAPPPGWTGKAWACHLGAAAARGELLLFLDADTLLTPDALSALLELREARGGLVSVQPSHDTLRAYEQLSAYFNAVSVLASSALSRRHAQHPVAFGPCLLTSRTDYEQSGGHAAVRAEILDDVALAVAYDRAGLPVSCFLGGEAVRMRSYPAGLRQLATGWIKNIATGAWAAPRSSALASVLWVCGHHVVAVSAAVAVATGDRGHLALWAVAWVLVAWQLRTVLRRVGTFRWWTWALFPVPLLAFDIVFAVSTTLTVVRRSVRWRERVVRVGPGSARGPV